MDEITLEGKKYFSSKKAAEITGYTKDYVGQLCREGRIKARLVGRNWYVLESSIKDHRFGSKESTETKSSAAKKDSAHAWESATYTHDEVPEKLPTLISQEFKQEINILYGRNPDLSVKEETDVKSVVSASVSPELVTEMHSAWQDWFSTKSSASEPEAPLNAIEEEQVQTQATNQTEVSTLERKQAREFAPMQPADEEITPIFIDKITDTRDTAEQTQQEQETFDEYVPIHRSYQKTAYTQVINTQSLPQQGRIMREQVILRKKEAGILPKAIFILIGIIVIAGTVVGSGKVSTILDQYHVNNIPLQYLAGQSTVK